MNISALNLSCNTVVVFHVDAVQEGEVYHQEFKPPPEGSATGVGKQEKVIPTQDPAHDQEQVQQR